MSSLLAFMTVSGLLGWTNIRRIKLSLQLPEEVYAGVETFAPLRVSRGRGIFPSFLLRLRVGDDERLFTMVEGSGQSASLRLRFSARGLSSLPRAEISSPFPINFFIRSVKGEFDGECLVFPRPVAADTPFAPGGTDAGAGVSSSPGFEGDLARISGYTGGEPTKMIHWRLSAKHDDLKVKHLSSLSRRPVTIVVKDLPGRDIEEKLSSAVFLTNRLMGEGVPVGVSVGNSSIPPGSGTPHRLSILKELALHAPH